MGCNNPLLKHSLMSSFVFLSNFKLWHKKENFFKTSRSSLRFCNASEYIFFLNPAQVFFPHANGDEIFFLFIALVSEILYAVQTAQKNSSNVEKIELPTPRRILNFDCVLLSTSLNLMCMDPELIQKIASWPRVVSSAMTCSMYNVL